MHQLCCACSYLGGLVMRLILSAGLCVALVVPQLAMAKRIKVAETSASSSYVDDGGTSYSAKLAVDGKASSSWFEGDKGSGLGSWIELKLGAATTVSKVRIWGGDWFSEQEWARANRPKEIELSFGEGESQIVKLDDEKKMHEFVIDTKPTTDTVKLKVKSVYSGSAWPDTAISEVQIFDDSGSASAVVAKHASSSELTADADGNYAASNVSDGLVDSMWCEGSKDGNGEGEWLEFGFGESKTIKMLGLVNGIGGSIKYWMKGNRVTSATLTFDNGSTQTVTVKNTMLPQMIAITPISTSTVKLTFDAVVQGKEYNDLCISEAYFR